MSLNCIVEENGVGKNYVINEELICDRKYESITKESNDMLFCKSVRDTRWRWLALALISFMTFGSYFCSDSPNSLSDLIYRKVTHESDSEHTFKYNQLYSIIYYPNIVLPLIGGILIDRIGLYVTIVIVSVLLTIGQAVFMVAGFMGTDDKTDNWPFIVAMAGRFIYGLGGDILGVCQSTFVTKWFMGKELSLALGIVLSISWCGQSASSYTVPPLAESTSLGLLLYKYTPILPSIIGFGLMLGVIVCILSFTFSLCAIIFDFIIDKYEVQKQDKVNEEEYKFHFKDLYHLNRIYWIVILNITLTYSGLTFYNFSNDFFQIRYGFNQIDAARINSNCYLVCLVASPLFGYISDKIGHRITLCIICSLCLIGSNILYIVIPSSTAEHKSYWGIAPVLLMGISSSIYAAVIYPMIPIVVTEKVIGTAYGASTSIANIGNSLGPILTGALTFRDKKEDAYFWVNIIMSCVCFLGLLCSLVLIYFNSKYLHGFLQASSNRIPQNYEMRSSLSKNSTDDIDNN